MSLFSESLLLLGLVIFSAFILVVAAAVGGVLKRLGHSILARMPRPFLGEGSNREWAERKRAELEAGQLSPNTPRNWTPPGHFLVEGGRDGKQAQGNDLAVGGVQAADAPRAESAGQVRDHDDATREPSRSHAQADGDGRQAKVTPAIEPPSDDV